jgi:LysM repeat protein
MAREQLSPAVVERRCPNCGTRVARDAESCFMCGYDLRLPSRRRHRVSWIDALLVLAVLAVLGFWWRIASQPRQEQAGGDNPPAILPTNIPLITDTPVLTATVASTAAITAAAEGLPVPTVAAPDGSALIRHRVRQGETLLAIATIYGVTVEELQAANNLVDVLIRAGDELIIPVARPAQQQGSVPSVDSQFEYTVQQGDTVISIAVRFGSTIEEILLVNNLTENDLIRPGDVLLVPVRSVPQEVLASSPTPEPAAQPTAAPTAGAPIPTPAIYLEPRLINPPDEAVLIRDEPVLLQWVSVEVLDPNEWYVLLIYPVSGAAQTLPSIWTKATSYRLETALAPPSGETANYAWQVSVVRVKPGVSNQFALEAASPPSEVRTFTWR